MNKCGIIISLDFELDYGYRGQKSLQTLDYKKVLESLIKLFKKYDVKSTWATVIKLLEKDQESGTLNQRNWILNELFNKRIEFASHSFNHNFFLEDRSHCYKKDQSLTENIVSKDNIKLKTIVFPRNQFDYTLLDDNYLFQYVRGNQKKWFLNNQKTSANSLKKFVKQFCEFIPLKRDVQVANYKSIRIVSDSRFFRFFRFNITQKLYSIVTFWELNQTIRRGGLYHIWFHPHNLMHQPEASLQQLEKFLIEFSKLKIKNNEISSYFISEI